MTVQGAESGGGGGGMAMAGAAVGVVVIIVLIVAVVMLRRRKANNGGKATKNTSSATIDDSTDRADAMEAGYSGSAGASGASPNLTRKRSKLDIARAKSKLAIDLYSQQAAEMEAHEDELNEFVEQEREKTRKVLAAPSTCGCSWMF